MTGPASRGGPPAGDEGALGRALRRFERAVVLALIALMMAVVALSTLELGYLIVKDVLSPPLLILELDELLDIFGVFLLVLIGMELLETMKAYLDDAVIHVEIVLEVAIIAVARKVIVLDLAKYSGVTVLGIAALVVALAVAFALERWARRKRPSAVTPPAP